MNDILARQLALDYCCTEEDVRDAKPHFTVYQQLPGRRMFDESDNGCYFKVAVVNNKLLVTGEEEIVNEIGRTLLYANARWFLDAPAISGIDRILNKHGWQIEQTHPFYLAAERSEVSTGEYEIRWYEQGDISRFRDDDRYAEAFAFAKYAPDVLGVSASRDGKIVGMAGASADSPYLWQLGINVMPECENQGVGSMLVALLKNEVLARGFLPYYGTAMSHLASQRVAEKAGFVPAWAELITSKL